MKITVKGYITCKGAEMYGDCADNYALNADNHKFAISDGVSKSFFPKIWSTILVSEYVNNLETDETSFINKCQQKWSKEIENKINRPEAKWYTRIEYNRRTPALATFVGLQFFENEQKWIASALGDTFLFFLPEGYTNFLQELVVLSSKDDPLVFDNFPDYFTSIGHQHKGLPPKQIEIHSLSPGTFYLMTDALAEWFVNEQEKAKENINIWKDQKDFERFVELARADRAMSDDDSAILIINLKDDGQPNFSYDEQNVTNLSDLVDEEQLAFINNGQDSDSVKASTEVPVENEVEIFSSSLLTSSTVDSEIKNDEEFLSQQTVEENIVDQSLNDGPIQSAPDDILKQNKEARNPSTPSDNQNSNGSLTQIFDKF